MFKNIAKIAFRNLWKHKGYTFINTIGLAIGIAAIVWGYQTWRYSFSFDLFHPDLDNVYRAVTKKDGVDAVQGIFPQAIARAAKADIPGITEAVRVDDEFMNVKPAGSNETFAENVHFTDPAFFKLFNFPLLKGSNDLADKTAVMITATTAKKYFGNEDPIGKTLLLYAGQPYAKPFTVKAVLKDPPENATFHFNFLVNIESQLKPDGTPVAANDWKWFAGAVFFKIPNPADARALPAKLTQYLAQQHSARQDWKVTGFKLYSLREHARLSEVIDSNIMYERPSDAASYAGLILAVLLLLSACLNFSNTTVARANQKLKEIGMRKVMGGTKQQLMLQLLMECAFIVLVAILLSVVINKWWLPTFNGMFSYIHVQADYLHDTNLQLFLLATLVLTSLLAGFYPAFYITRFNPANIFRGSVKFGGSNIFSRAMLGLQVAIAIITIVSGIAFARNTVFQKNFDFGYDIDNSVVVAVKDKSMYEALRNEMAAVPQVKAMAGTRLQVGFDFRTRVTEVAAVKKEVRYLEVGDGYTDLMKLKLASGRKFEKEQATDYTNAVLITQKLAAAYGWTDQTALNRQIHLDTTMYSVVGVLKDFHSNDFFSEMMPVLVKLVKEDKYQYLVLQANHSDLAAVMEQSKKSWQKLFPLQPFRAFYQNEIAAESYKVSNSIASIFTWFSFVCILLTATGLFALVSLTVLKRTKEIAIRKVAGANPRHILLLISSGYGWIFILSALLGSYGGYVLTDMLLNMIFKVNAGVGNNTLLYAVTALFAIAVITTCIKVWQAVKTNPVKMLRTG